MPVPIQCPNPACGKVSLAPDEFVGRSVRCRVCGRQFSARPTLDGGPADTRPVVKADDPFPKLPAEFGRYRVLRRLGRGGMGAVYLADDTALRRHVALKLPTFAAGESPQRVERFLREAQAAAGLAHPNVCTVFDVGRQDGRPFITMAFIDGKPLDAEIDPDRPMPERRAADLARTVARALQAAHDKGIVHRDLKPGNVMVTPAGEPVVMDFGLAKRVADPEADAQEAKLTHAGAVLGTPSYMAPEQVRGEVDKIGPAADVYALGVVLFELLTGRVPYRGAVGMVMGQILAAPVPPLTEFRPDADPRLAAICRRAMAKEVGDRVPSMTAFAEALDEYLRATDPTVRASRSAEVLALPPAAPPAARRRWPLVAGGVAAALALVVTVALLLTDRPKQSEATPERNEPVAKTDDARPVVAPPVAAGPPPSDGFVPLFNGKDLTGWRRARASLTVNWAVETGVLVGKGNDGPGKMVTERDDFGDVHVRAKVRVNDGGNSGLLVRTGLPREDDRHGYFVRLRNAPAANPNRTGNLYRRSSEQVATAPSGEATATGWLNLDVIAEGNRVRVLVNGTPTADYTDPDRLHARGRIGFQVFQNTVLEIASIEVKELTPPTESTTAPAWQDVFTEGHVRLKKYDFQTSGRFDGDHESIRWKVTDGSWRGPQGRDSSLIFRDEQLPLSTQGQEIELTARGLAGGLLKWRSKERDEWSRTGYRLLFNSEGSGLAKLQKFRTRFAPRVDQIDDLGSAEAPPADANVRVNVVTFGDRIQVFFDGVKKIDAGDRFGTPFGDGSVEVMANATNQFAIHALRMREVKSSPPGLPVVTGPKPLAALDLSKLHGRTFDGMSATFAADRLTVRRTAAGGYVPLVIDPAVTLPDEFTLKARGRVTGGPFDEWKLILGDGPDGYHLNVLADGGNCFLNDGKGGGVRRAWTGKPGPRPADGLDEMVAVVRGDRLDVFVNGGRVLEGVRLPAKPAGRKFGLSVYKHRAADTTTAEFAEVTLHPATLPVGETPKLPDLTGVKPLFAHDFRDPKTTIDGKPIKLEGGKFVIRHNGRASGYDDTRDFGRIPDQFVATLVVRLVAPFEGQLFWHFNAVDDPKTRTSFKFKGNGMFVQQSAMGQQIGSFHQGHFKNGPFKPPGEVNEVTVAVRGRRCEVYVNYLLAGPPLELPNAIGPGNIGFWLWREEGVSLPAVELESLTVWPLPTATPPPAPKAVPAGDTQAAVLAALKADPKDPVANLSRGKHLALTEFKWDEALAYLELADADGWKAAARAEQAAGIQVGPLRTAGDAWWKLADTLAGREQYVVRRHAADVYLKAIPTSGGSEKEPNLERIRAIYGPPDTSKVKPVLDLDFRKAADAAKVGKKMDGGATAEGDRTGLKVSVPALTLTTTNPLGKVPKEFVLQVVGRPTAANPVFATYLQFLGVRCVAPDLSSSAVRVSGPPKNTNVRTLATFDEYERAVLRHDGNRPLRFINSIPHVRRTPDASDVVTVVVKGGWVECYLNGVLIRWYVPTSRNELRYANSVKLARPAESHEVELLFDNNMTAAGQYLVESLKAWPADGVQSFYERNEEGNRVGRNFFGIP